MLPSTRNLPFVHRPNSCIVVWQQLIYWLVLLASLSLLLSGCPWFTTTGVFVDTQGTQPSYQPMHHVECLTLTAISVDRLLALLLGIRYRQIVTLKRTYIIAATFWILSVGAGSISISHSRIIRWYSIIVIALCSVISIASYTKIFRTLRHHQAQVQDHVQQQPSQETALNMERYRKAVSSALWVQLALAVCYVPKFIILVVINHSKTYSSRLVVIDAIASILVYFNSTLNPFLYCWRIREVRQAVKQTIQQALCFPST